MDQGFPGECVSKQAYAPSFIMLNNVRCPLLPSFTKSLATYANKMVCMCVGGWGAVGRVGRLAGGYSLVEMSP